MKIDIPASDIKTARKALADWDRAMHGGDSGDAEYEAGLGLAEVIRWLLMRVDEPVITTTGFTAAEQAAWRVAVDRGLNIAAADLRALVNAYMLAAVTEFTKREAT